MNIAETFFLKNWKQYNNGLNKPLLLEETTGLLLYPLEEIGEGDMRVKNFLDDSSPEFVINRKELLTIEEYSRKINEISKKFQQKFNPNSIKNQGEIRENSTQIHSNDRLNSNTNQIEFSASSSKYLSSIYKLARTCKQTSNIDMQKNIDNLLADAEIFHAENNIPALRELRSLLLKKKDAQGRIKISRLNKRPPTPLIEEISNHKLMFTVVLNPQFIRKATNGFYKDFYSLPATCPRDIAKALYNYKDEKSKITRVLRPDGTPYKVSMLSRLFKDYKAYREIIKIRRRKLAVTALMTVFITSVVCYNVFFKEHTYNNAVGKLNKTEIEKYISVYEANYMPIISQWREDTITNYLLSAQPKDSAEILQTIDLFNNKIDW